MVFGALTVQAPLRLDCGEFVLRPLVESDAELDYEAVMESREQLRAWEQSTWPADDFTVDANRDDLHRHAAEHRRGESFTYTVVAPDEGVCLGCVYLFPPTVRWLEGVEITAVAGGDEWSAVDALVYFWVRTSSLADGLDRRLLEALCDWLTSAWPFARPVFVTNEGLTQQVALLSDAGLAPRFELVDPDKPAKELAFERGER